ncbi:MAG: helix-turn-helix transcriptional regulator, partial [Caldilineaceae bacterium]|nr:helix-turn-helix transcriptional regulator [Caldilineaceae bacterium]
MMLETVDSRAAILAAAQRLFVERGYRGISMREIAEAVGMTKAALYYHFRDKEQLFVALLQN